MAGKAYTMREMRAIVEYLNERKAYGELKGRKMWMEFSNSNRTTRTWQSLKETFLKRILPDIQNPYYKLTMDQVRSFRQGIDIAEKERNNRLEFRTADTILNAVDQNAISTAKNDNEVPTSHENEEQTNVSNEPPTINIDDELEKVTGEDIKAAKIPSRCRSSAETLVLEYENAEDVQRVLESPNNETQTKSKSLKDMLTFEYSAPLTPLVRDLLNDFETESEASDAEPRLNIDEELPKTNNIESEAVIEDVLENIKVENAPYENDMINNEADPVIETHDTDKGDITETNGKEVETTVTKETSNEDEIQGKNENPHKNKNQDLNSKCDDNEHNNNNETIAHSHSNQNSQQDDGVTNTESTLKDTTVFVTAESNAKTFEKSSDTAKNNTDSNCIIANTGNSTQNTSSDTLLPNNQEALEDSKKETQKAKQNKTGEIVDKATKANEKRLRKRTSSRDSRDSKKQKLSDGQSKEVNNEASVPIIEIDDSSSPTDLEKDNVNKNQEKIEISSNTLTLDNTEEQINAIAKNSPENDNKQSTKAKKDIPNAEQEKNTTVVEDKNPCLVSVNLYDEQFNNTKYSDSDSDDITEKKQNTDIPQAVTDIVNDVTKQKQNTDIPQAVTDTLKEIEDIPQKAKEINEEEVVMEKEIVVAEDNKNVVRNSDSSADSELRNQGVVNNKVNESVNLQRERALANVFGFAHGLVAPTSRKRHLSHRRRSHHHRRRHSKNTDSNSSEWTSESDSESYVSPPRGRKNRHTKKYLKPKSSRILQDPEEGMLYVMFGKNVYPLVKGEKHIKKFLTYIPDSGSDEDESFWKQKYIEENKRVEEVRKLLKDAQKGQAAQRNEPTVATTSRNGTNSRSPHKSTQNRNDNNAIAPVVENKTEAIKDDKMVFKIAGKNGLEYSLEGGWYQISNAMPQVVRFLQYETGTDNAKQTPVNGTGDRLKPDIRMEVRTEDLPKADIRMEVSSGVSTPVLAAVDTEVHEKVNKLEDEIFNKIKNLEARQMEEEDKKSDRDSTNVTRRKQSRPIKESSGKSPAKRARSSKTNSPDTKQDEPKTKRVSKPKLKKPDVKQDEVEKTTETSEQQNAKQIETESTKVTEEQKGLDNKVPAISSRRTNLRSLKHREKSDHNLGDNAAVGNRTSLRLLRTPKKYDTDTSASEVKLRPTPTKEMTEQRVSEDDNARYMFPPAKTNKKSAGNNRR